MANMDWQKSLKAATNKAAPSNKQTPAQKVASNMDKALAAWKKDPNAKRAVIKTVGDVVQFSVRFANQALELAPNITIAEVPAVQFQGIYDAIKASVLDGSFDQKLAPLAANAKDRGAKMAASKGATGKAATKK